MAKYQWFHFDCLHEETGLSAPTPAKVAKPAKPAKADGGALATLAALAAPPPRTQKSATDDWGEVEEERSAVVEHDAGIPRAWAEALARLDRATPPAGVPFDRWRTFIDDAAAFLARWAAHAIALGWHPLDLFGCDRQRPFARIDRAGLLWLLDGGRVLVLSETTAVIATPTGTRQTYRRRPLLPGEMALAWELSSHIL